MTDTARYDRRQLGRLLDPHNTASAVWADSAWRSAADVALLMRRGLVAQFQRPKPRGKPMPPHVARANASRARVRVAIEHAFDPLGRSVSGSSSQCGLPRLRQPAVRSRGTSPGPNRRDI